MEDMWPREEPMTGRMVFEFCYNQQHKLCKLKPCNCACHDPRPPKISKEKDTSPAISDIYGNITV